MYKIVDGLEVGVRVDLNPYGLELDQLFGMAARINKKRAFLFVSKLLGKHIAVHPSLSLASGALLGDLYASAVMGRAAKVNADQLQAAFGERGKADELYARLMEDKIKVDEPTLFIGFAETATALGHSVFEAFEGNAAFLHTTRELISGQEPLIRFEEEHSHATAHRCYARDAGLFRDASKIVLVDDEITTGRTSLNIIRELHEAFGHRDFVVASLLDWRSSDDRSRFAALEAELGIRIRCLALVEGAIEVRGLPVTEQTSERERRTNAELPDRAEIRKHDVSRLFAHEEGSERSSYLRHTGRFGIEAGEVDALGHEVAQAAEALTALRTGARSLCIGTGEFMYLPMRIAALMGDGVVYQSTTRSPIHPTQSEGYAVTSAYPFDSVDDAGVRNFVYNIEPGQYDEIFVFIEREYDAEQGKSFEEALARLGIPNVHLVFFGSDDTPAQMGSYRSEDVVFLLKDLNSVDLERGTEDREEAIQSGTHYSEMLPVEYRPSAEYIDLFHHTLRTTARQVAEAVAVVSERIVAKHSGKFVLASLARAGTPVGVLIKRYIRAYCGLTPPHYSISIIRGKGIDENALKYMLREHPDADIQFVDGWTGKGAIRKTLIQACAKFERDYGVRLNDDLAVLADPGRCSGTYGTRDDFLIPSACLNSTVSGLVSRTVLRSDLIGPDDFHGAKYYREWSGEDLSNLYVDAIAEHFDSVRESAKKQAALLLTREEDPVTWQGEQDIRRIQRDFGISDMNLIKPGVGETTRVLLRRVPWKILVNDLSNPNLVSILLLAKDRGVPVEEYPDLTYSCCGIIKPLKEANL